MQEVLRLLETRATLEMTGTKMEPVSGTDIAIGWAIIVGTALACYYGIPFLIVRLVRSVAASREQDRLHRERIQDDLDEQLRQEMLAWAEEEHEEAAAQPGQS